MKNKIEIFILISALTGPFFTKPILAATESLSVAVEVSGDIQGKYDLSGPIGKSLESEPADLASKCKFQGLFRKVIRPDSGVGDEVEVWITLNCMIEGQKNIFKLHRIYLDPKKEQQSYKFTRLSKNIQQIEVKFQDLSLKTRK